MSGDKVILKAEDLDGYLTQEDQNDLAGLQDMYKKTMEAFDPLDKESVIKNFDDLGHKMQEIVAKHPNIKVYSFETEEGAHA